MQVYCQVDGFNSLRLTAIEAFQSILIHFHQPAKNYAAEHRQNMSIKLNIVFDVLSSPL